MSEYIAEKDTDREEKRKTVEGTKDVYPDYDAEAEEVCRMKEECDRMAKEIIGQIDALLVKIDGILSRDREINQIVYTRILSAEDRVF